jgi:hypothetical protein
MGGDLQHVLGANKVKPEESTMGEALAHTETSTEIVRKPRGNAQPASAVDFMKKSAKFRTIGTKRVNNALKIIGRIGNLSNRQAYAYTDADVKKLVGSLRTAVESATSGRYSFAPDADAAVTRRYRATPLIERVRQVLLLKHRSKLGTLLLHEKKKLPGVSFFSLARGTIKTRGDTSIHRKDCLGGDVSPLAPLCRA